MPIALTVVPTGKRERPRRFGGTSPAVAMRKAGRTHEGQADFRAWPLARPPLLTNEVCKALQQRPRQKRKRPARGRRVQVAGGALRTERSEDLDAPEHGGKLARRGPADGVSAQRKGQPRQPMVSKRVQAPAYGTTVSLTAILATSPLMRSLAAVNSSD
jgi:hypothetical protein